MTGDKGIKPSFSRLRLYSLRNPQEDETVGPQMIQSGQKIQDLRINYVSAEILHKREASLLCLCTFTHLKIFGEWGISKERFSCSPSTILWAVLETCQGMLNWIFFSFQPNIVASAQFFFFSLFLLLGAPDSLEYSWVSSPFLFQLYSIWVWREDAPGVKKVSGSSRQRFGFLIVL